MSRSPRIRFIFRPWSAIAVCAFALVIAFSRGPLPTHEVRACFGTGGGGTGGGGGSGTIGGGNGGTVGTSAFSGVAVDADGVLKRLETRDASGQLMRTRVEHAHTAQGDNAF